MFDFKNNGKNYRFYVYSKNANFSNLANKSGVYLFLRPYGSTPRVIYVGQSSDLATRLSNHERFTEANRLGMSHIAVALVPVLELDAVEKALITKCRPMMNSQGV